VSRKEVRQDLSHFHILLHKRFNTIENNKENEREYLI